MTKSAPSPLVIPTIPKKGDALPAVVSFENGAAHSAVPAADLALPRSRLSSRVQATIAVTVRLDEKRYEQMKTWGTSRRITNQEVVVAALDDFFRLSDDEREERVSQVRR